MMARVLVVMLAVIVKMAIVWELLRAQPWDHRS